MSTIKTWSYSSLKDYEVCAHAWMHRRILKTPEPKSKALINGEAIHAKAEAYLTEDNYAIPLELALFGREFKNLKACKATAEEELCLNSDWQPVPDGWSSEETWLRLKTDARIDNFIVDFKTGKYYPSHEGQAKLYANAFMCKHPEYDKVDVEFWYLDASTVKDYTFNRDDLDRDKAEWTTRVNMMLADKEWLPKEHEYCKYCFVRHLCPAKNK